MSAIKTVYAAYNCAIELPNGRIVKHLIVLVCGPTYRTFDYTTKEFIPSDMVQMILHQAPVPRNIKTVLMLADY